MTAAEVLRFCRGLRRHWNDTLATRLVDRLGIPLKTRVGSLSRGTLVELGLVAAAAPEPELLLLDEPMAGLDPPAREEVVETVVAANSLAGERADRSAEFIAPLPVSRAVRLMAKVVLLAAVAIALWAPMLFVASLLRSSQLVKADDYRSGLELLGMIATFAILTTALAWLLAGWIESPVIAAVMAIAMPVAVPWAMFCLQAPFLAPASFFGLWVDSEGIPQPLTFLVAAAFFAAGSALYLRRLE